MLIPYCSIVHRSMQLGSCLQRVQFNAAVDSPLTSTGVSFQSHVIPLVLPSITAQFMQLMNIVIIDPSVKITDYPRCASTTPSTR